MTKLVGLFRAIERSPETAYILTRERRIVRTNDAFDRFARENGGEHVLSRYGRGACIDDAMSPPLRAFYVSEFERALASGERFDHEYDCDSPTVHRRFRMLAYPHAGEMLVVVNALVVERPHVREATQADDETYTRDGVIAMCAHCRRTRRPGAVVAWDWVPGYVERMPSNLSHGLCEACSGFYALS